MITEWPGGAREKLYKIRAKYSGSFVQVLTKDEGRSLRQASSFVLRPKPTVKFGKAVLAFADNNPCRQATALLRASLVGLEDLHESLGPAPKLGLRDEHVVAGALA